MHGVHVQLPVEKENRREIGNVMRNASLTRNVKTKMIPNSPYKLKNVLNHHVVNVSNFTLTYYLALLKIHLV